MINRFCSKCGSPFEMHVERVPDGQFVPLGTIDQWREISLNEGLWGEFALPHVAFKDGREVRKQGGSRFNLRSRQCVTSKHHQKSQKQRSRM